MKRILAAAACLALLAGPAWSAPTLRAQALVAGEIVTVGDLVDDAGAFAGKPLFRSPDLGETGAVATADVLAAAASAGVPAINANGLGEVSVTRAAREFSLEDVAVAAAVRAARLYGADARSIEVDLGAGAKPLRFSADAIGDLEIVSFTADPRSGRFEAAFDVADRRGGAGPIRVSGIALETVEAAIPVRSVARGEIVAAADVKAARRPKAAADGAATVAEVVGMAARRALREGQTVRADDLMRPQHVSRGAFVTLVYLNDGVSLSLKAKALANGAAGDLIGVQNLQSKRVVNGVVTGPSEVTVTAGPTAIARR